MPEATYKTRFSKTANVIQIGLPRPAGKVLKPLPKPRWQRPAGTHDAQRWDQNDQRAARLHALHTAEHLLHVCGSLANAITLQATCSTGSESSKGSFACSSMCTRLRFSCSHEFPFRSSSPLTLLPTPFEAAETTIKSAHKYEYMCKDSDMCRIQLLIAFLHDNMSHYRYA